MSVLQNLYRRWQKYDRPEVDEIWKLGDTAEQKTHQTGLVHFNTAMNNLLFKLQQAELRGDFENDLKIQYNPNGLRIPVIADFLIKAKQIKQELFTFYIYNINFQSELSKKPNQDKEKIKKWSEDNKELIASFLLDLNIIYLQRTASAIRKDFAWELADAMVAVLASLALAHVILPLTGVAIFGGAFAHLIAPTAAALAVVGVFKYCTTQEKQLNNAIQENLARTFKLAKGTK